jgi:two-component system nitrate/nitrite response regulator NarL
MSHKTTPIRIAIIDDHRAVRTALKMLLEDAGMEVIALAGNRSEALDCMAREQPDVILLDLDLGSEDGLSILPELRELANSARVLIFTGIKDPEAHRHAVRAGAVGVVLKDQEAEVLLKAIEKVHAGEVWLDRAAMGNLLNEMTRKGRERSDSVDAKIESLTDRENQVIALIAEGLKNKQIAERLFISETTVTHHLSSIFSKLEVSDRLELVIYAFGHNLASLPK